MPPPKCRRRRARLLFSEIRSSLPSPGTTSRNTRVWLDTQPGLSHKSVRFSFRRPHLLLLLHYARRGRDDHSRSTKTRKNLVFLQELTPRLGRHLVNVLRRRVLSRLHLSHVLGEAADGRRGQIG